VTPPRPVLPGGAILELTAGFLAPADAARNLASVLAEVAWTAGTIVMFGRRVREPRLSAWMGDRDAAYTYSGRALTPLPWTPTVAQLRDQVSAFVGHRFNSVLLNRYRDGNDAMGFHADDEPELGDAPVIASLSLGGRRRFLVRHRKDKTLGATLWLEHGSLLVMGGTTQEDYRHALPRMKTAEERVNLTFRCILPR